MPWWGAYVIKDVDFTRAVSSAGTSACFTRKRSLVQTQYRPPYVQRQRLLFWLSQLAGFRVRQLTPSGPAEEQVDLRVLYVDLGFSDFVKRPIAAAS